MKHFILSSLVLVLASCGSIPSAAPKDQQSPQWIHVFDAENKIAASVNSADGKVVYFQSEDVAFRSLFQAMLQQIKQQTASKKTEAPKSPAPKK